MWYHKKFDSIYSHSEFPLILATNSFVRKGEFLGWQIVCNKISNSFKPIEMVVKKDILQDNWKKYFKSGLNTIQLYNKNSFVWWKVISNTCAKKILVAVATYLDSIFKVLKKFLSIFSHIYLFQKQEGFFLTTRT